MEQLGASRRLSTVRRMCTRCSVVRVEGDEARTWRAMLRWKPPTPLALDAFLGIVVLEEKDHFVGPPRLGYLRIEIS